LIEQQSCPQLVQFIIKNGSSQLIEQVIKKKLYMEYLDDNNEAPIHYLLCHSKNEALIKLLIDSGVNLELLGKTGMHPIHYAIKYNTPEIIKYLSEQGVKFNC